MNRRVLFLIAVFGSFPVYAAPVSVDTSAIGGSTTNRTGIGFTTSATTRPYDGIGTQRDSLPYFTVNLGRFYINGLNLGYRLNDTGNYRWDLVAIPRFLGYKETNSTVLAGLGDTDYSIHGGLSVSTNAGPVRLNGQVLTDLLSESGGTEVIGTVSKTFKLNKLSLTPAFSLNWQDSSLVDHYYGVANSQATATRSSYSGDATVNAGISLTAGYQIIESLSVIGVVRFDQYGSEIEDSPIVDSDTSNSTSVGLIYSF